MELYAIFSAIFTFTIIENVSSGRLQSIYLEKLVLSITLCNLIALIL